MTAKAAQPEPIARFLAQPAFAVVGASPDRAKYGNKVLRCYLQHGRPVVAVNPKQTRVEGQACVPSLRQVPAGTTAASVVAPPLVARQIVDDAVAAGIGHLWFQPGAEQAKAVEVARKAGLNVIADGSCLLVTLGFRDE